MSVDESKADRDHREEWYVTIEYIESVVREARRARAQGETDALSLAAERLKEGGDDLRQWAEREAGR